MVPDFEELGGRDLHALQVGLRRHAGGAGGEALSAVLTLPARRDNTDNGGDGSDGSSRRRPAEGYLWGRAGPATPPGAALPLRGPRLGLLALRGGAGVSRRRHQGWGQLGDTLPGWAPWGHHT